MKLGKKPILTKGQKANILAKPAAPKAHPQKRNRHPNRGLNLNLTPKVRLVGKAAILRRGRQVLNLQRKMGLQAAKQKLNLGKKDDLVLFIPNTWLTGQSF